MVIYKFKRKIVQSPYIKIEWIFRVIVIYHQHGVNGSGNSSSRAGELCA